jgi:hypothetical protein
VSGAGADFTLKLMPPTAQPPAAAEAEDGAATDAQAKPRFPWVNKITGSPEKKKKPELGLCPAESPFFFFFFSPSASRFACGAGIRGAVARLLFWTDSQSRRDVESQRTGTSPPLLPLFHHFEFDVALIDA